MKGEQPKKIAKDYDCTSEYVVKRVRYWREKNNLPEPPALSNGKSAKPICSV